MSEQQQKPADSSASIPAFLPEDLIPVWIWCRQNGAQWLVTIAIAVLLAAGLSVFLRHRAGRAAQASEQLLAPPSIETLEKAVADYGTTAPGVAARLKLAKAYYDGGRYTESLAQYDEFLKKNAQHPFADVARVGRGFAFSGLGRYDEALEAFRTFRTQNPGHYLVQQATFGEAACLTQQGKKSEAKLLVQELRAANRETPWEAAAKRMEGAIDRYQPRAPRSLFEQAEALVPIPPLPKTAPTSTPAAAVAP